MAQWAHYSTPNEEYIRVLAKTRPRSAVPQKDSEDGALIRQQELVAQACRKRVEDAGPVKGVIIEEKRVPVSTPPDEITVKTYIPESQDASETFPLYVNMHGGGFYIGTIDMDELACREISVKHRVVVVNVEYRLAPQFPFPTGLVDSYEAVKWAASNTADLKVDLKKGFIIAGVSSGGNFACVIAQLARYDPVLQEKISGQVLQIPSTVFHSANIPERIKNNIISRVQNKDDPILTPESMAMIERAYKPGNPSETRVSPLLAGSFAGLPPAYIQVAGADPLRDEGLLYNQLMQEAGVPTKLDVYPGVSHGFAQIYPQLELSAKWRSDFDAGVQWLLEISKV